MANLMRIREPLAWAMVVLSALMLVYQAVQLGWNLVGGVWDAVGDGVLPPLSIGWVVGWGGIDYALPAVLVAAVIGCFVPPAVARARVIARTAAWVTTVTVALPWVAVVFVLLVSPASALASVTPWEAWLLLGVLHPLIATGVGVVAAVALWALARPPAADDSADDSADGDPALTEVDPGPAELEAAEDEHPTVWKPAEATGTVWRTADEAAAGAPGARSLEPGATAASDAERAEGVPRPDAGKAPDWRPPSSR